MRVMLSITILIIVVSFRVSYTIMLGSWPLLVGCAIKLSLGLTSSYLKSFVAVVYCCF